MAAARSRRVSQRATPGLGNLTFVMLAAIQMLGVGTTTLVAHAPGRCDRDETLKPRWIWFRRRLADRPVVASPIGEPRAS